MLAVQLLFASNAVVGRVNVQWLGPKLLVLLRVVVAALVFLALARRLGARLPVSRGDLARLGLCAILGVSLNQACYLTGLAYSTATHASLIGTSVPVFTAAVAALAGQERMTWRKAAGIGLALTGALYLARVGSLGLRLGSLGDLLFLANSLSYACYLVLGRSLLRRYGAGTLVVWTFALGAILILPFGLPGLPVFGGVGVRHPLPFWIGLTVAYTILFPTVLAYLLNAYALERVDSSTAAAFIYLQPIFATALALPILHERLSPRTGIAAALIFLGILLSTLGGAAATLPDDRRPAPLDEEPCSP